MIRRLLSYALLIVGTIMFAWPFLWMASTSIKLEREIFGRGNKDAPQMPAAPVRSPYIDEREFSDVSGPRAEETIKLIAERLPSEPREAIARAVYSRLLAILP